MIGSPMAKLKELGPWRVVQSAMTALFNLILQKIYRFDPWHVSGNYYSRPYKARVIALAERDQPQTIVEIGAGLCDIIGRVQARNRIGLDLDDKVLKAARHLVSRNVQLAQANFLDPQSVIAALKAQSVESIDCLILVNWIHMISMDEIAASLSEIAHIIPIRHVLFDAIRLGTPNYRYHHRADDFARLGRIVEMITGDTIRDLILIARDPIDCVPSAS